MATAVGGSSLSKGVFVFKGSHLSANIDDYISTKKDNLTPSRSGSKSKSKSQKLPSFTDPNTDIITRMRLFDSAWNTFNSKLKTIEEYFNEDIVNDLVRFVNSSSSTLGNSSAFNCDEDIVMLRKPHSEITTAALVTGVNVTDHSAMFTTLANELRVKSTKHVVRLCSTSCMSLQALFLTLFSQLWSIDSQQSTEDEALIEDIDEECEAADNEIISNEFSIGRGNRKSLTMSTLAAWYAKTYSSNNERNRPLLVFIIEDFEGFPTQVLQDFISICGHYIEELPIVLLFGLATSQAFIHQALPYHVSSLLSIETFSGSMSTNYLSLIIDQVLMGSAMPFRLGGKTFDFLLDKFLYHDFSVQNFHMALKFCMLEHYERSRLSVLCVERDKMQYTVDSLSHLHLDDFRSCRSFRRYVENCPAEKQIALLEDDQVMKKEILSMYQQITEYHTTLPTVLKCLHSLTCELPKHPLGKQLRELYALCLCVSICESAEYQQAIHLIRSLSRDDLSASLSSLSSILTSDQVLQCDALNSCRAEISRFIDLLVNIDSAASDGRSCNDDEVNGSIELMDSTDVSTGSTTPQKMNIQTLRQKLQKQAQTLNNSKSSEYDQLRNNIMDYLDKELFRKHLMPPYSMTLHEAFYYNDVSKLKQNMNAAPRVTMQRALNQPHRYLSIKDSNGCTLADDVISPLMPDLCIVYKLHLECGRLINLYDWLQAFITIVKSEENEEDYDRENTDVKHKKNNEKTGIDKELQARFIRAVSELQLLGFIKATKRKTDHVARLTWGAC